MAPTKAKSLFCVTQSWIYTCKDDTQIWTKTAGDLKQNNLQSSWFPNILLFKKADFTPLNGTWESFHDFVFSTLGLRGEIWFIVVFQVNKIARSPKTHFPSARDLQSMFATLARAHKWHSSLLLLHKNKSISLKWMTDTGLELLKPFEL